MTGIDVSSLPDGTLTYSVTLTDAAGNAGSATTATATLDRAAPAGYSITVGSSQINAAAAPSTSFTFAGAEVGATYTYTVTSTGGGTPVTGSGIVSSATQQVTGINVSSLPDGTLTYSVTLTDAAGNAGIATTAAATLDNVPAGYTITANKSTVNAAEASSTGFTFAGAEVGASYSYSVASSGGGTPVMGTGIVSSATQQVTGIDISSLPEGTLTYTVTLTDTGGNLGAAATATATLDRTVPAATTTAAVNGNAIVYTISFNEGVTGFDVDDLTANGSVTGPLTLQNFTVVLASSYSVEVVGMTTTQPGEQVTLRSPTAGSFFDLAANPAAVDAVFEQYDWAL